MEIRSSASSVWAATRPALTDPEIAPDIMTQTISSPASTMGRKMRTRSSGLVCALSKICLLYTSDAADDLLCVDLGGRRIIKKKKKNKENTFTIKRAKKINLQKHIHTE